MKICAVYKITNTITNDFYIGSSKNVKRRWAEHKCKSTWNKYPNKQLYQDMQKYGVDKFEFEIIEEVEIEQLKKAEQQFIETLKPTYNSCNAKGVDIEKHKECQKRYRQSEKGKEYQKKYKKEYQKTEKGKESKRKYNNQLCCYNGQTLTLHALSQRFWKKGLSNPTAEAKKYLLNK